MAGAALGEVQVSLFVAGAALGECLNVRLGAKCCNFQYKMLVVDVKSNLGCEAGCGGRFPARIVVGLLSDHCRIGRALEMTFQVFSRNFGQIWDSQFFVAGAIFGEVGGRHMLFRAL